MGLNTKPDPITLMMYGPSGSSKTTQLYFIAKWLWETKKLTTRLITGDPGGYRPFVDSGMVDAGIVEVFDYTNRELALADIRRLSKGYWPRQTAEGTEYFKSDDYCITPPDKWATIGAYMLDGMTSVGEALKSHVVQRPGNTVGFKESWEYEEDGEVIRGSQQGHYGIVQEEVNRLHRQGFRTLPVKYVVWTALVGKGEEKQISKEIQYGPQLVGNAYTPYIPSWFVHCLHLDKANVPKVNRVGNQWQMTPDLEGKPVTEEKLVAWFTPHNSIDSGIKYLTNYRLLPEKIPTLLNVFPFGCVPLEYDKGVEQFLRVMEKLTLKKESTINT